MPLHPLAEHFAQVAEVYERGRPEYTPEMVQALGLGSGARVLDLAAGTGKLTRALVAAGLDVEAVEPQRELRDLLAGILGGGHVHEGLAEAIPFPDASFDAVTVADAFHWFDQAPALTEIARVLRPGGLLVLISALPELPHEVGLLIAGARPAHPYFDGTPWPETLRATPGWGEPRSVSVPMRQHLALRDYVTSMSWVAALPDAARAELLAQVPDDAPEIIVHAVMWLSSRD
ncbi:MAG: class I SAM-dependent methyltransferase [Solirubrobacteraceae bacterium]